MQRLGNYALEGFLAKGGQGAVYRAHHVELGTPAAVKVFEGDDPRQLARFEQEARVLARLHHPSLPRVLDFGRDGRRAWFAMELVAGDNLAEKVKREGIPAPERVCEVLAAVAEALEVCHREGVIHRDVKPQNVLVETATGRAVLADFGLLKLEAEGAARTQGGQRLSLTGEVRGTPSFMAPEQAEGSSAGVGPAADVYGLGAALYYLLAGRPPFAGTTAYNVFFKLLNEDPSDPRRFNPAAPPELVRLALRSLAKTPSERPPSAAAFAAALRQTASRLAAPRRRAQAPSLPRGLAAGLAGAFLGAAALALALVLAPGHGGASPPTASIVVDVA
ncbi:MAG: serine/threonine protein kinase, partial [Planctomycetota bacterium]